MGAIIMDLYLKHQRSRYLQGNRAVKKQMLDEFCDTHGYHRKSATRFLNQFPIPDKSPRKSGKNEQYKPEILLEPLKTLWLATDQMCGKRLKQALPLWLAHYDKHFDKLPEPVYMQLLIMTCMQNLYEAVNKVCEKQKSGVVLTLLRVAAI